MRNLPRKEREAPRSLEGPQPRQGLEYVREVESEEQEEVDGLFQAVLLLPEEENCQMKFGKRTVVGEAYKKDDHLVYDCVCECGLISTVRASALKRGEQSGCRSCSHITRTEIERFSEKWKLHPHRSLPGKGLCWEWTGALAGDYGGFRHNSKFGLAHRFSHSHYNGPIPEGFEVHHLCEFKRCVNPEHIEALAHKRHVQLTGSIPGAIRASVNARRSKTHCPQGHEYNEENTRQDKRNNRACRVCGRERQRRYKARKTVAGG